jgi:DNA-binding transcriptional ArsR family regulator
MGVKKSTLRHPRADTVNRRSAAPALPNMGRMQERAEEASELLKSLGNAHRLRILCLLVDREMTVGQINEQLVDLSQSALSQHLARLREQGLVHTRREAQTIWYALAKGPSERIMLALHDIYCSVRG